jgi:hypothetical protein
MASVAEMIRKKLDAGTLPLDAPAKLWAGIGAGRLCAACEQAIGPTQSEYELEYDGRSAILLHAECHRRWEDERQVRELARTELSTRTALRKSKRRPA